MAGAGRRMVRAAALVLCPAAELVGVVEGGLHLGHATELARGVDTEEEVDLGRGGGGGGRQGEGGREVRGEGVGGEVGK